MYQLSVSLEFYFDNSAWINEHCVEYTRKFGPASSYAILHFDDDDFAVFKLKFPKEALNSIKL
jgi:hypothetical protein